jgi:hypothetical protein
MKIFINPKWKENFPSLPLKKFTHQMHLHPFNYKKALKNLEIISISSDCKNTNRSAKRYGDKELQNSLERILAA